MPKKPRPRAKQREAARSLQKLQDARQRLFALEVGGTPERPVIVTSAAVVEAHAESVACPRCKGRHDVVEHVALTIEGRRLREARLRCRQCGTTRSLWFCISEIGPN